MASLGEMIVRVGANLEDFNRGMDSMQTAFSGLTKIGAGLTAGLTLPIVGIGSAAISAAADMEQAKIGFTTLLKSGDAAALMLTNLRDFAAKTPFQFPELIVSAQRLMAMGFAANEVIPSLQSIGGAVAALGAGPDVMNRIVLALGQMRNSAKLSAADMKQLTEAGISGWQYLSKATGIAMSEIQEKAKDVLTGAQAAQIIMQGMSTDFAGGMEAQSKSLIGSWSNVQDKVRFALADIGAALLPLAKTFVDNFAMPMIEGLKAITQWFTNLPAPIQNGILALTALLAVAGPVLVAVGALGLALPSITAGFAAIGALGPIILTFGTFLSSTIAALVTFATAAIPAAISALLTFAGTTLPLGIAAIGKFSTAILVDAARSLAAFATVGIPSAMTALTTFATVSVPAAIAAMWTFITVTIPAGITALISFATAGVGAAVSSLTAMAASAIPFAIGALSALGVAAIGAAAIFVGWKIGQWAYEQVPGLKWLADNFVDLAFKIPLVESAWIRLSGATGVINAANDSLAASVEMLRKKLADKGIAIERGTATLEEYSRKLRETANAPTALIASVQKLQASLKAKGVVVDRGTLSLEDYKKKLEQTLKQLPKVGVGLGDYGKALKGATEDVRKMTQQEVTHLVKLADLKRGYSEATDELLLLDAELRSGKGPLDIFSRALDGVTFSISDMYPELGKLTAAFEQMSNPVNDAKREADALGEAFKAMKITSSGELKTTAEEAKRHYETIKGSTLDLKVETGQAWAAMTQAEIDYRTSLGEDVTGLQAELDKWKGAHENHKTDVKTIWGGISQDITAAFGRASLNLSDAMRDLFTGEFSIGKVANAFKQLGLDIASAFLDVAAAAVMDFIKTHIGALLESLGGLLSKIPLVGDALGGVFGKVGGSIGGAGSAAGGVAGNVGGGLGGGVASGGVSSLAGWITAGAGIATAVSSIIGNFQEAKQEKTLNAIEESTRYSKVYNLLGVTLALEFWPYIKGTHDFLWGTGITAWSEMIAEIQKSNDYLRDLIFKTADMLTIVGSFSAPQSAMMPATSGGFVFNFDFRGATISDDAAAERLAQRITDRIRTVVR